MKRQPIIRILGRITSAPCSTSPTPPRVWAAPAAAALLLWSASLGLWTVVEGHVPVFAFAVAGYGAYLAAVGAWLLPRTVSPNPDEVLRASSGGPRLAVRCSVVLLALAFVYMDDVLATLSGWPASDAVASWLARAHAIRLAPGLGGYELVKFGAYALLPGLLLLALGASPRELGICLPARGTLPATLACLVPVVTFVGWGIATRRLSPAGLCWLLLHNFFSNGFTEEFQCRGMVLSHLRAFLPTGWAQLGQALIFALLHFHFAGAAERASPWGSLAEDLVLNLPVALAFGFLAVRSRSLALLTLLHLFRWIP